MKKDLSIIKEYVSSLSDEDLTLIFERLTQPVCGDRADVSLFFQKSENIDKMLSRCHSATEWFDKVDLIQDAAEVELKKRQSKEKEKVGK
jgi:hypothetical protein